MTLSQDIPVSRARDVHMQFTCHQVSLWVKYERTIGFAVLKSAGLLTLAPLLSACTGWEAA